ncbi:nucleotidyltransferase [Prevotella sp. PINT]|jgi:Predicted nucleotidyltransferases|uniref:nucleotidyltransferase family protein n=1 Tax=Palleniella intestinalis TaxID=2736291 RepID=UPI00155822F1|nr:nucleotidyltransferase domain-containing protein [Palleniella intestinalis]NPD82356.1 nucleotidyltransferase [Palleniella intestinalis]
MINKQVREYIPKIRALMKDRPIKKVWLFGSCSRGEERPDSDIDLLFEADRSQHFSLFTQGAIYMDLNQLLGRKVDFIEDGALRPYARETVERDKILIYERGK